MHFFLFRKAIRKLPGDVIQGVPLPEPELTDGFGSRAQAGIICRKMGAKSVLVVTDKNIHGLGFHEKILLSLRDSGIPFTVFCEIDSEPTVEVIRAGRKAALDCGADCIVALGGGSVMDASKVIAASARDPRHSLRWHLQKFDYVRGKTLPIISIPTTAGTGAEYTVGAVVKNARGVKQSTVIIGLNVQHVILDSELMVNAPVHVTVWCGIDALSHGLEGLLADVRSEGEDVRKSRECVRLVLENLPRVLENPKDIDARQKMSLAAYYGGNAINRQLAGYVHAFAHSIGALYHIPHGKAIAWCLVPVVEAQKDKCESQLWNLAVWCGIARQEDPAEEAADRMIAALRQLLEKCGLEKGCVELREEDYPQLVKMIDADSINYSPPKTFSDREIIGLLDRIRKGGGA